MTTAEAAPSAGSEQEILQAVKSGDLARVGQLLDADPSLASARGENGESLILLATYYGRPEVTRLLLERGARPDIFEACAAGQWVRVVELLDRQPELVDAVAPDGFTPLGLAAFFRHASIVRTLLERGATADLPSQNQLHVTPLQSAAAARSMEIVELLLARGADPNSREGNGFTALHAAADNGQIEMVRLLLDHGADANARAENGKTPLGMAVAKSHAEVAQLLRERGGVP
jgi:ankyrin repeat protein